MYSSHWLYSVYKVKCKKEGNVKDYHLNSINHIKKEYGSRREVLDFGGVNHGSEIKNQVCE